MVIIFYNHLYINYIYIQVVYKMCGKQYLIIYNYDLYLFILKLYHYCLAVIGYYVIFLSIYMSCLIILNN